MKKYIIHESAFNTTNVREIHKTPLGTIKFVTVLQEANRMNRNKRIYPKDVLVEALKSAYVKERLNTHSFYGEAGHPLDTSLQRQCNIDQTRIAFLIHEMWWEGDLLMGKCETANTAVGKDMAGLIEQGSDVAFSLRAQGAVTQDPVTRATVVKPGLQIITFDWVVNPSHDKAFIQSICEESKQYLFNYTDEASYAGALAESAILYESGNLMEIEEELDLQPITENYIPGYRKKFRTYDEIYFYDPEDKLITESITADNQYAELKNRNVTKKVVLEDYLAKDLRNEILNVVSLSEAKKEPEIVWITKKDDKWHSIDDNGYHYRPDIHVGVGEDGNPTYMSKDPMRNIGVVYKHNDDRLDDVKKALRKDK